MDQAQTQPDAEETAPLLFRYRFANAQYDDAQCQLLVDNRPVAVEPRPLRLLAELLRHVGEVVTKEELFEAVWEGRVTVDNVLANAVNKLRRALGAEAGACIVNVPRVGYRLVGPVRQTAVGQFPAPPTGLQPGSPVPRREGYRLVRALGSQPRGNIWLARHVQLGEQRVFKFATTARALRNLKREVTLSRVLKAGLGDRTDLVQIRDAEFSAPPFFIEIDYVGPDLLTWATQDNRLAGMPRSERLALFIRIASAVAGAHSVGVLHKDIKPGNVLMRCDEQGHWTPVLTDFGSGDALQPDRLQGLGITAMGLTLDVPAAGSGLVGTAAYLAPELLAGQPATMLSDVYALGVMLYQLVVGDLGQPLAPGWQRGPNDALLCEDIAAATDLDPAYRLSSVSSLIDRVSRLQQRHREREQAEALAARTRQMEAEQRRKAQRRPWLIALVLALSCGLAASTWMWRRSELAASAARAQMDRANVISQFAFRDVLESPDLLKAGSDAKPTTLVVLLRQAAAAATVRFAGQPRTEAEAQMRLAQSFLKVAAANEMNAAVQRGLVLLEPIAPKDDPLVLKLRFLRAHWLVWTERTQQGEAELLSAEAAASAGQLAADPELAILAARARALLHREKREIDLWRLQQLKLIDLTDRYTPPGSADRLDALQQYAETLLWLGRIAEAKTVLDGLAQPPFGVQSAFGEAMAKFFLYSGMSSLRKRDLGGAVHQFEESVRWCQEMAPSRRDWLEAWGQEQLAAALARQGRLAEALAAGQQARALITRVSGPDHAYVQTFGTTIADVYLFQGRPEKALALYDQMEAFQQRTYGKRPWSAVVDFGRGRALLQLGRPAEALPLLGRVDRPELRRSSEEDDAPEQVAFWQGLALARTGQVSQGTGMMRKALSDMAPKATHAWALPTWNRLLLQAEGRAGGDVGRSGLDARNWP